MTRREDLRRPEDAGDGRSAASARWVPRALQPGPAERPPEWGEAYLLFDGDYRSLDDFLRAADE